MNKFIARYWGFILIILFVIFLHSCKSPGDDSEVTVQQQVYEVEIKGMKFVPEELWINSGDVVIFTNRDLVVHDVTQDPEKSWTSKPIPVDSSWRRVFRQSEDYLCTIHPVMKGKIKVR